MYEQAMRLNQESQTVTNLKKQTQCYLACINALRLVDEPYRWIARPIFETKRLEEDGCLSEKKRLEFKDILRYQVIERMKVLELEDITKEYVMSEAKLKLAQVNTSFCKLAEISNLLN